MISLWAINTKNQINMNRSFLMFSFLSGTLVFSSCVTKKQYAQLQTDYNKLDKSYQDTKMKLVACGTKSKSWKSVWPKPEGE